MGTLRWDENTVREVSRLLEEMDRLGQRARTLRDLMTGETRRRPTETPYVQERGGRQITGEQKCDTPCCAYTAVHIGEDGTLYCGPCYRDQVLGSGAGAGEVAGCHQ